MTPRPPTSTLFPYTTLFRSATAKRRRCAAMWWRRRVAESGEKSRRHTAASKYAPSLAGRGYSPSTQLDRKSTRLNSSHVEISYAVFCLKKKKNKELWGRDQT